jgi:hypothetical protein
MMTFSESCDKFGDFLVNKKRSMFLRAFCMWVIIFGVILSMACTIAFAVSVFEFILIYVNGYIVYNVIVWSALFGVCCLIVGKKAKESTND